MAGIDDINVNFDGDDKKISIDENILGGGSESQLNIKNDDALFGVDLLANKNYSSGNSDNGYSSGEESTKKKEDYDFFKDKEEKERESNQPTPEEDVKSIPVEEDPLISKQMGHENGGFKPLGAMSAQEIKNEKIDLIYKFKKLESQGIRTTMNYNMNSHLEDMRNEYLKLKKQREVENSIKLQRKVMMAAITGLEYLNNKFDPFDVKLDGWSESINENITDYDEVFEELAEKYGGKSEMAPELKLLMMLGGSAFMFHLTNTMFKSSIPGMDDIMKQNPDLMKQFAQAAVGSIGQNAPRRPTPVQKNIPKPSKAPRKEMNGPAGMDDIMNEMNFQSNNIPDLDTISLLSGDSDRKSSGSGVTLNI